MTQCTFCGVNVKKSRASFHYSRAHKHSDLTNIWPTPNRKNHPNCPKGDCIICLEKHTTKLFPCNHTHSCRDCLFTWWKQSYHSPRCPICKQDVEKIYQEGFIDRFTLKSWRRWRNRSLGTDIFDRPILLR